MLDFKKIKFKKIIYPLLLGVFFLSVIVTFIYAVKFLSNNFKQAFSLNNEEVESQLVRLNLNDLFLVSKKLGSVTSGANNPPAVSVPVNPEPPLSLSATSSPITATSTTPIDAVSASSSASTAPSTQP